MFESPILKHVSGCVGGQWMGAKSRPTLPVINPATGETLAKIPDMGEAETRAAVEAAASAVNLSPSATERREWLLMIAELLVQHREELARIITLEQGKPLRESAVEVDYAAGFFRFFAGAMEHLALRVLPQKIRGSRWKVHQRPAGVAALITPWNFPVAMLAKKLSAAIAAGCSVVARPSELTPLSAIAFWLLAEKGGLPMQRLNLVLGRPGPIGQVFCQHPQVRVISFTGSTETGKLLLRQSAPHVKRLALELGGNAPLIVFADADLEWAAEALVANKFRCAGQTCVCANRVYVQQEAQNRFVELLAKRVAKLQVGNGLDPGTDLGPLINRAAFEKVAEHVADALEKGAQQILGHDPPSPAEDWGCYYPPTILVGAHTGMRVFQEETFGPVIAVATFASEDEVITQANSTPYGLAAYVFTGDPARAQRCAERLQFGHVAVNSGTGPTPEAPFGGMKQSGFGREGGWEGLLEFVDVQTIATA